MICGVIIVVYAIATMERKKEDDAYQRSCKRMSKLVWEVELNGMAMAMVDDGGGAVARIEKWNTKTMMTKSTWWRRRPQTRYVAKQANDKQCKYTTTAMNPIKSGKLELWLPQFSIGIRKPLDGSVLFPPHGQQFVSLALLYCRWCCCCCCCFSECVSVCVKLPSSYYNQNPASARYLICFDPYPLSSSICI